ncbi:MAG TPA: DUF99 family protein [bacterium]|nr:DUF99 family protein [bacterium]
MPGKRPHVLGVDDAPLDKWRDDTVPIVGVMMENATVVEGVAVTSFPIDGEGATQFLAEWIGDLKWAPMLHAVILGGITIAGLGMIDLQRLADQLHIPVIAATRHDTADSDLDSALKAAGLIDRLGILQASPPARRILENLYAASAGAEPQVIEKLIKSTLNKARMPEPLRIAHLIGAALVQGSSHGKV